MTSHATGDGNIPTRDANKKGLKKTDATIMISILEPIEIGLNKEIFLKNLENSIYNELNLIS